jgi:hypothetical protein
VSILLYDRLLKISKATLTGLLARYLQCVVVQMMTSLTPFFPVQVVKLGDRGVLSLRRLASSDIRQTPSSLSTLTHESPSTFALKITYHPSESVPVEEQVSSTGNGSSSLPHCLPLSVFH